MEIYENGSAHVSYRKACSSPFQAFLLLLLETIQNYSSNGADSMGKAAYIKDEFMVIQCKKDHVLINMNGKYENHGHVKKLKTAKMLIKLMKTNKVPHSAYLRETVLRVSLDESYRNKVLHKIEKDKQNPKFIKVNKGVVRK